MKGSVSERLPADTLSDVRRQQASGILRLERGPLVRQIFIDAGASIRFAASTFPSESMTALFKEKAGVTDEAIKQATAAKQPHELLGTVLARLGLLDRQLLTSLTEEHIRRVVHGALLMRDGEYEFQEGALPFREQLDGGLSVSEILLEWARDVPDIGWIRKRLGSEATRVRVARRPPEGYQTIPLNPAEGYTMSRVDGQATLREICIVSPMGEETALRALLGLTLAGIIEIADEKQAASASPPPPAASAAPRPAAPPAAPSAAAPPKATVPPKSPAPAAGGKPAVAGKKAAPGPAKPGPAVLPGRVPGNGGAPKRPATAAPRKATPAPAKGRPPASADLENEVLERFARMRDQDLYQVLGMPRTTSVDDIRRAYYTLAKRLHPDKFTREEIKAKAEKVFGHITEAYSTLSHAETRAKYDEDLALRHGPRQEKAADTGELARSNFKAGKDHFDKGKLGEALSFFQNACDQDPSKAEYFHHLAMTQAKNPRWKKEAEANFLKALEIDPSNGEIYAHLGTLYARGGVHSKAREMWKKALDWDPANAEALDGLQSMEAGKKGLLGLFGKK